MDLNHELNKRQGKKDIQNQYNEIVNADFIDNIFDSLPHVAAVLNQERQIIFSNRKLLNDLGLQNIENVLGARPGEILLCEHSNVGPRGCGTSEKCQYCSALNVVLKCQSENTRVESEATIVSKVRGETVIFEFGIVVNPFEFKLNRYYILSLFDISDKKRRMALERIFLHDVMNQVGSLNGFLDLIKAVSEPEKFHEYIITLDTISQQLTKEILSQKQLLEAENGTLAINEELIDSKLFLESLVTQISNHQEAKDIKVELITDMESFSFLSDPTLLGRILINMLKNAVEASSKGDLIKIQCQKKDHLVLFKVNNPAYMPDEIQVKIFNKSFSTKDTGRGIGTYSMKLLTEKYLKGKIHFESDEREGTTFSFEIPHEESTF
ncbi:MAG: histidine kinase [Marinilabiliales bacterium]|nr:MAG: histidine kinase [Marinilabiliales bacterium]